MANDKPMAQPDAGAAQSSDIIWINRGGDDKLTLTVGAISTLVGNEVGAQAAGIYLPLSGGVLTGSLIVDGVAPQAVDASLDVQSTDKGFSPPSMTTAQRDAIVAPRTGLIIDNAELNCLQRNFGTAMTPSWGCLNSLSRPHTYVSLVSQIIDDDNFTEPIDWEVTVDEPGEFTKVATTGPNGDVGSAFLCNFDGVAWFSVIYSVGRQGGGGVDEWFAFLQNSNDNVTWTDVGGAIEQHARNNDTTSIGFSAYTTVTEGQYIRILHGCTDDSENIGLYGLPATSIRPEVFSTSLQLIAERL